MDFFENRFAITDFALNIFFIPAAGTGFKHDQCGIGLLGNRLPAAIFQIIFGGYVVIRIEENACTRNGIMLRNIQKERTLYAVYLDFLPDGSGKEGPSRIL